MPASPAFYGVQGKTWCALHGLRSPGDKEKDDAGDEVEGNKLHSGQPGGFAIQTDQREEDCSQP